MVKNKRDILKNYLLEIPNFLSIFIVPVFFVTASHMLLEMSRTTDYSIGNLSLIFTFFNGGLTAGQLTSIFYNRKFKKIHIILAGYIIIIPCLILLMLVRDLYLFYIFYCLIGYFAGVIWMQATKYILENDIKNKDRLFTIFLNFYPIGHITAPFIASYLINHEISWRYSYMVMIFLVVIIFILYFTLKKFRKTEVYYEEEKKLQFKKIFFDRRLNIIFILGCIPLTFYAISETVISTWASPFLQSVKFFDVQTAGLTVSIFWIAVIAGRIIVSAVAGRFKANYIIMVLSVMAIVPIIVFISVKSAYAAMITVACAGLGYSGIITLGISSASTVYKKGRGVLASIVFAAANSGIFIAPFITRFVSGFSMNLSIAVAPLSMALMFLFIIGKNIFENNSGKIVNKIKK